MPNQPHTPEEYLAFERDSEEKHEYLSGEIFLMAGASAKHNQIVANANASLLTQLRQSPCIVYASDLRVKVNRTGLYTYPDITVVGDPPQFEDAEQDTLLNPTLIVEVLSPSTERYDRGKKFQHFRTLENLQEYVLIAQDTHRIERYRRQDDGQWLFDDAAGIDAVTDLTSIDCHLALADVYEKVTFDPA